MGSMVERAFDAGWGGAVWKTLGEPIINVSSRLAGLDQGPLRLIGLNNIELITDRPLDVNLKEIYECKKKYPNHAVIVVLDGRVETRGVARDRQTFTGHRCDGFELNFGCPHGMSERGMGAAMGQVPEYTCMVTEWVKEVSTLPVIVKLTPNVTHIVPPGRAAQKGGADAVSLINTINSVMGVDVDTMIPYPNVNGMAAHGGYCGTGGQTDRSQYGFANSLAMRSSIFRSRGIGGINTWRDAVEFMLLGAGNVQVCTAVMHYGYRIVEDMIDGLNNYLDEKGFASRSTTSSANPSSRVTDWGNLDLNYDVKAHVNNENCIRCNLCYVACEDGAHQSFEFQEVDGNDYPYVIEEECVGCNLCYPHLPLAGSDHDAPRRRRRPDAKLA